MGRFLDVHRGFIGAGPAELAALRAADAVLRHAEDVEFERTWLDPDTGMVFCLSHAPSKEAVMRVHERGGYPTTEVYEMRIELLP